MSGLRRVEVAVQVERNAARGIVDGMVGGTGAALDPTSKSTVVKVGQAQYLPDEP